MANNFAFIDSQNVHKAILAQGWTIDWRRFRQYLRDKYDVLRAYMFIGYVKKNERLYESLQEAGFVVFFKPTISVWEDDRYTTKGNVDAELILHCMIEWDHFERAMIVSGDGDFYCLVRHLIEHNKLLNLMIPNPQRYSALLREFHQKITYMHLLREKLERDPIQKNEREYPSDGTLGVPSHRNAHIVANTVMLYRKKWRRICLGNLR